MIFYILLSIIVTFVGVFLYKCKNRSYWKVRNVIQYHDALSSFVFGDRSLAEVSKAMYDKSPGEPYVGYYFGAKPALLLRDLTNIQAVLSNDFESFYSRGILINENDILGNNILTMSDYDKWKLIRQKISPIFTSAKLKNMCYIIDKCARDFVEMVKDNKSMRDKPFNALYTYTTASIGSSVFGINTRVNNSMDSPFLDMAWKAVNPTFKNNFKFLISSFSPGLFKFLNLKPFGDDEEFFVGVVKKVLKSRRNSTTAVHDFIDLCLELQKSGTMKDASTGYSLEPTDEVMAAQAFFFFIAGADTSANTMNFTLLQLASNPEVLKRLHKEIDAALSKTDDKVTYDVIDKLEYLEMVLNETMRMYPPVGVLQRECTRDTVLPVGNIKIEKGVMVTIPVYGIHRDPMYFSDPDVFNPERFARENMDMLPKFGFLPFGEGKRICLGARYARLQVKAGLVLLLRSFTLREQKYTPKYFEKSVFALRDSGAHFELIPRDDN